MLKILICTVGGSPQPLIMSIEHHKPQRIIYVASQSSRLTIRKDIESVLSFEPEDTQTITLSNEQDLLQSVKEIRLELRKKLETWGLSEDTPLIGDFTGGTKPMSAALVLALMECTMHFTYVGGAVRTKNGLGIVEDGYERILPLDNPWDALALQELQSMSEAFNSYQFDAMEQIAHALSKKACMKAPFYAALATLAQGYSHWDAFNHKSALMTLQKAKRELQPCAMSVPSLQMLLQHLDEHIQLLEKVCADVTCLMNSKAETQEHTGQSYLLDLLANAQRRARLGKYDDALARLYSAIEKAAKIRLRVRYGIETSNIDCSLVPEHLREDLEACRNDSGKIQIPLQRAYQLLLDLDDDLGKSFASERVTISNQLQKRNNSLLAHGYTSIDEKDYTKLYAITLQFLGVKQMQLPKFPEISARDIFF